MSSHFIAQARLRRLGQSKSKGFTSIDFAAHIFLVGISVMTLQIMFTSPNTCQSIACQGPRILRIPAQY